MIADTATLADTTLLSIDRDLLIAVSNDDSLSDNFEKCLKKHFKTSFILKHHQTITLGDTIMTDAEKAQLYKQIENEIDSLPVGDKREYAAPEFSAKQLLTIDEIIKDLKKDKYANTISVTTSAMRVVVTKLPEQATSVFSNLTIEKSEQEVQAEQAYEKCLKNNHKLSELKSPNGFPILVCNQCKIKYTLKLSVSQRKLASVSPL